MSTQTPSLRVLGPVVPEKHSHHSDVLSSLSTQGGQLLAQGSASLDGTVQRAPALPAPLPLTSPSGLSRTQFMVASHAATLPAIPAACGEDGGLVLDRVLLQGGSSEHQAWWAALTGRAKLQRILGRRRQHGWQRALGDPEGYTLGLNARLRARPGTNLKISAELQPRSTTDGFVHVVILQSCPSSTDRSPARRARSYQKSEPFPFLQQDKQQLWVPHEITLIAMISCIKTPA